MMMKVDTVQELFNRFPLLLSLFEIHRVSTLFSVQMVELLV